MSKQERERGRERETAAMIDASLPPLCSSKRLQQKLEIKVRLPSSPVALNPSFVFRQPQHQDPAQPGINKLALMENEP